MRPGFLLLAAALALAGCRDRFSPDTYATRAVQQADRVEQGVIVGVRPVRISADGTTGAAAGAAAGGVIGAQVPGGGLSSALGGVGGALVGSVIGRGAEHVAVDTLAYEYIIRTTKNELMRVTQQDREPLRRGQAVLLITGAQARVVPDYTQDAPASPAAAHRPAPPVPTPPPAPPAPPPSPGAPEPIAAPPAGASPAPDPRALVPPGTAPAIPDPAAPPAAPDPAPATQPEAAAPGPALLLAPLASGLVPHGVARPPALALPAAEAALGLAPSPGIPLPQR